MHIINTYHNPLTRCAQIVIRLTTREENAYTCGEDLPLSPRWIAAGKRLLVETGLPKNYKLIRVQVGIVEQKYSYPYGLVQNFQLSFEK